jgi:hypothetical protein
MAIISIYSTESIEIREKGRGVVKMRGKPGNGGD